MTLLAPASRARRAALPVALCAGLTVVLTACAGEEPDPDAGTNGVGKLSATAIEAKARAAAGAATAVRLSGTLVSKGGTYELNMRLNRTGAAGSVVTKTSTFELLRVGDTLYLKADADFWASDDDSGGEKDDSGEEAADKLDDKYVKVPQDDPSYKQLRGFTEMNVLLNGLLELHGDVVKGDRSKIGGVRTIKVAGGAKGEGGTLDVSLEGTPYPLQFARGGGAGLVVLSDWNKAVPLTEPSKDETLDYGRELPRTSD
ncbi:hypothetical protein [Streptomyces ficellus]|uniref:hypothetical protein n=1 Tax=Streptomyces ficellus TaxID=1977088 RepID=UPI001AD6A93E|nr:hypothetical protein [Streptomyces ficellus]